jgi:redox-sensing transcriptional repressor
MGGRISDSAVRRLSLYLRMLRELGLTNREFVSSHELAERAGATSAQVRKDLSLFGSFGKRGRGYSVGSLSHTLEEILGLVRTWKVGLVGVGKIGTALLGYRDLDARGFDIVAAFDVDDTKIGKQVFGLTVSPLSDLERIVKERGVEIGIIATPPEVAAEVAKSLGHVGVGAILNFAPTELQVGDCVAVRTVDISLELEGLSYLLATAQRLGASKTDE